MPLVIQISTLPLPLFEHGCQHFTVVECMKIVENISNKNMFIQFLTKKMARKVCACLQPLGPIFLHTVYIVKASPRYCPTLERIFVKVCTKHKLIIFDLHVYWSAANSQLPAEHQNNDNSVGTLTSYITYLRTYVLSTVCVSR